MKINSYDIPSQILGFFHTPDSFYQQIQMRECSKDIAIIHHYEKRALTAVIDTPIVSEYMSVHTSVQLFQIQQTYYSSSVISHDEMLMDILKILYYDALMMMLSRKYVFAAPTFRNTYSDHNDCVDMSIVFSAGSQSVNPGVDGFIDSIKNLLKSADDRSEISVADFQSAYLKHSDGSFVHLPYLERFVKHTDLNMTHGPKNEFEFLCRLRGIVTGELR